MKAALFVLLFLSSAVSASSVELRSIEVRKGTKGLNAAPVSIVNATGAGVSCVGELAHWYSAELAVVAAGETAVIDLWHDPETGTFTALNDKQENMPVDSLWCGVTGKAYETRSLIVLPRQTGKAPPIGLTCSMGENHLACQ